MKVKELMRRYFVDFSQKKTTEWMLQVPTNHLLVTKQGRKKEVHQTFSSHQEALAAFHAQCDALFLQGAVDLGPWHHFESPTQGYHVRLPVGPLFSVINLNTGKQTNHKYATIVEAIEGYNQWVLKARKKEVYYKSRTWEEAAATFKADEGWVEQIKPNHHYFVSATDPSFEFGPEFHHHDNGLCKYDIFQIDAQADGPRLAYNEQGEWTHLEICYRGKRRGATYFMNPDATIDQVYIKEDKQHLALFFCGDDHRVERWTFDGEDEHAQKHGVWFRRTKDNLIESTFIHGQRTKHTFYYLKTGQIEEESEYHQDGSYTVKAYTEGTQTLTLEGKKNANDDWIYENRFLPDGSFEFEKTYTYHDNGALKKLTSVVCDPEDPDGRLYNEYIPDEQGNLLKHTRYSYPEKRLLKRLDMHPDGSKEHTKFYDNGQLSKHYTADRDGQFIRTFSVYTEQGKRAKEFTFPDVDPRTSESYPAPTVELQHLDDATKRRSLEIPWYKGSRHQHRDQIERFVAQIQTLIQQRWVMAGPWISLKHPEIQGVRQIRLPATSTLETREFNENGEVVDTTEATLYSHHHAVVEFNTRCAGWIAQGWAPHVKDDPLDQWPHPGAGSVLFDFTPEDDPEMSRRYGYIDQEELSEEIFMGPYREWFHTGQRIDTMVMYEIGLGWGVCYRANNTIELARPLCGEGDHYAGRVFVLDNQGKLTKTNLRQGSQSLDMWIGGTGEKGASWHERVQGEEPLTWTTSIDPNISGLPQEDRDVPGEKLSKLGIALRYTSRPTRAPDEVMEHQNDQLLMWRNAQGELKQACFDHEGSHFFYSAKAYGPRVHEPLNFQDGFGQIRSLCLGQDHGRTSWLELCQLIEQLYALYPERAMQELVPYVIEQSDNWPVKHRMAPWLWINKLLHRALPVTLLNMVSALSLSAALNTGDYWNERTGLLVSWLRELPELERPLQGLHLGFHERVIEALRRANKAEPDPRFHAESSPQGSPAGRGASWRLYLRARCVKTCVCWICHLAQRKRMKTGTQVRHVVAPPHSPG